MKLAAVACLAALGVGCSLLPPSGIECGDVPTAICQSAVREAESVPFLPSGEVIERRVVRRTEVRSCMEPGMPLYDVDLYFRGNPRPLSITVVQTDGGELVACTY